jgi:signal transduction histidine kinase
MAISTLSRPAGDLSDSPAEAVRRALSSLRHELGQPLTVIQGFSELICNGDLSPDEMKEYAAEIFREVSHLAALIARTRER